MIFLTNTEIDKNKWDDALNSSVNKEIYAYSWYLDMVCPNWGGLIQKDYQKILPLPLSKKFGFSYISQPFFCQQLGLYSNGGNRNIDLDIVLDSIPREIRFLDYHFNSSNSFLDINSHNSKLLKRLNQCLRIDLDYNDIYDNYSHGLKENIRKARKKALTFQEYISEDLAKDFVDFFKSNLGEKLILKSCDYDLLHRLITASFNKNKSKIFCVRDINNQINSLAFLLFNDTKIYLLAHVSNHLGRHNKSSFFLLDRVIQKYAAHFDILDFCGSNIEGIHEFNSSFGAVNIDYYNLKYSRLPFPLSLLKPT